MIFFQKFINIWTHFIIQEMLRDAGTSVGQGGSKDVQGNGKL